MNRGEITGEFFRMSDIDKGMPVRSNYVLRDDKRKNISILDKELNTLTDTDEMELQYFDPSVSDYAKSNISGKARNNPQMSMDRMRNTMHVLNTDYLNNIIFDMFTNIQGKTMNDFCIFPLSIIKTLIANDETIDNILYDIKSNEIFHQIKQQNNQLISRASICISIPLNTMKNKIDFYEDNDNYCIEVPMNKDGFKFGIISNKNNEELTISKKLFSEYILNMKQAACNIYCHAFKMGNKLNLNSMLKEFGYINTKNMYYHYIQNIYFELQTDIYMKTSSHKPLIELSNNIIYYVRYVPSNIVLFIGKKNQ